MHTSARLHCKHRGVLAPSSSVPHAHLSVSCSPFLRGRNRQASFRQALDVPGRVDCGRPQICASTSASSGSSQFAQIRRTAAKRLSYIAEQIEDTGRRTADRINRTLHVQERLQQAGSGAQAAASEGARRVDRQFGVKRRLASVAQHVQRNWPQWQRQLRAFNKSPVGQVFWAAALIYSLYSGIFLFFLKIFFLLSWLLPVIIFFSASRISKQVQEAQRMQQQQAAQQQRQQQQMYSNPFSAFRRQTPGYGAQSRSGASKSGPSFSSGGPVIDAEYETIDEGDR